MAETDQSTPILQARMPGGQRGVAARGLPGMQPVGQVDWVTVDDAYGAQLAEKARLLQKRDLVLRVLPEGQAAAVEALREVLKLLAARADFGVVGDRVTRPDGVTVHVDAGDPMAGLARLLQEDICILERSGDEHVMTAALLCFPASWTLDEKIGKPLTGIHRPVPEYDGDVAARVQRLFDGVQVGNPIWRANLLRYEDASLFQPCREDAPRAVGSDDSRFERSERQTLFRLPKSRAVVFAIHTTVALA